MNQNTNEPFIIKVSSGFTIFMILFGILFIPFILWGFWLRSKRIEIINTDAKYKSWFTRTSIKNIESIDVSGFWILNSVKITGRGNAVIKIGTVGNLKKIKEFSESIEHLKN